MASERYKRYSTKKFMDWKDRVRKYLPKLIIQFYTLKINGMYIDYDIERMAGRVIKNISDPYYGLMNEGKPIPFEDRVAWEVILEIDVNKLFSFIVKHSTHNHTPL